MEDYEIVELYLNRDEAAIEHTAKKYGSALRRIAHNILDDMPEAEECENDTYLKAWKLIPPNQPKAYLFAFLGRIARHTAIDRCRKRNAQRRQGIFCELTREMSECITDTADTEDAIEANALRQTINSFLAECSDQQRNVFVRRYWFFDTIDEISRRYGYSESKVKTMLFRMRSMLKLRLESEGYKI